MLCLEELQFKFKRNPGPGPNFPLEFKSLLVFGELRNVVLEENGEDKMVRESN